MIDKPDFYILIAHRKGQKFRLNLTDGVIKLNREPRPGAEWSGFAAPGLGVKDSEMTKNQKIIRAKVGLL
ncbi:hypothetical protein ACFSOZ_19455 [Mesorhizobium newzealandense]|uniref:Uncharacterized protein n=1 Tax=Mesorhizobium newzealandense TaxID=1300302 RepID=A0ABW4UDS1_9HYPH